MTPDWRSMTDAEREREYSPSSRLPDGDYRPFLDRYRLDSDAAWNRTADRTDASVHLVRYGDAERQVVDVAVPAAGRPGPLLAFIHGGYWQELSRIESRFAATACVERGWGFAAIDHTLAPRADLDQIVEECRRAVGALSNQSSDLGFDASRLVLAGSSAGAHLAAMVAATGGTPVAGLVLVSGIYELEPLIGTSVNDLLGLDAAAARRNSPLLSDVADAPPTLVAHGSDETSEFRAQSTAFARHLTDAGTEVTTLEVAGRHHFDVIMDLAEPGTALGDAVEHLMRSL